MLSLSEKASGYLQQLEDDRLAAIAASEEKAWEAKLIGARLEGFRQAMELLGVEPSPIVIDEGRNKQQPGKRRNIPKLILTELAFSGDAMTTNQIAGAIDYVPQLTEKALRGLESSGQIMRQEDGRWTTLVTIRPESDGAARHQSDGVASANGTFSIRNGEHKE